MAADITGLLLLLQLLLLLLLLPLLMLQPLLLTPPLHAPHPAPTSLLYCPEFSLH